MLSIIGIAVIAFLLVFSLHVAVARLFKPKSEDHYALFHYVVFPALLFCTLLSQGFFGWITPESAILSYLLFFVITSSWVASYPAIYADCPTLVIALIIYKSKEGIGINELRDLLELKANSMDRIEDAASGGLLQKKNGRIHLTATGEFIARIFKFYRRALGLRVESV